MKKLLFTISIWFILLLVILVPNVSSTSFVYDDFEDQTTDNTKYYNSSWIYSTQTRIVEETGGGNLRVYLLDNVAGNNKNNFIAVRMNETNFPTLNQNITIYIDNIWMKTVHGVGGESACMRVVSEDNYTSEVDGNNGVSNVAGRVGLLKSSTSTPGFAHCEGGTGTKTNNVTNIVIKSFPSLNQVNLSVDGGSSWVSADVTSLSDSAYWNLEFFTHGRNNPTTCSGEILISNINYSGAPDTSPPTNSSWNVTSGNVVSGESTTIWNTQGLINITSNLLSLTVIADENSNGSCRVDVEQNYTQMVAANANYKFATTDTTSHAYTVFDNITIDNHCLHCSFIDSLWNEPAGNTSSSGCLNFTLVNTAPNVTLNKPDTNATLYYKNRPFNFNFSYTDDTNISVTCHLYINTTLNQTKTGVVNNTITNFNVINLTKGTWIWNVTCDDGTDVGSAQRTLYINNTAPNTATLNSPTSGISTMNTSMILNATCTDDDGDNVTAIFYAGISVNSTTNVGNSSEFINGSSGVYNHTGLSIGTYYWRAKCWDGTDLSINYSSERNFTITANITLTLENLTENVTAELGSFINITANITGSNTVCVDVDHPEYGTNYSCGVNETSFILNVTWFRKEELNDSSTVKNLTFIGPQNQTVYINAHQYDELINFTINLTGYKSNGSFPNDVKIYINNTLSNDVGMLLNTTENTLDELSNNENSYNVTFTESGTEIVYLKLLKEANVTSAYMNLSGVVSEGAYTGESFSVISQITRPRGITQNGTYIWVADDTTDRIFKYSMDGTYTGEYFDIGGIGNNWPFGITQNGTYFWVVEQDIVGEEGVYKYYMNGTYTGEFFDVNAFSSWPRGITQNGTYIWITQTLYAEEVDKYYINGTYAGESFSTLDYPYGITQDGTHMWIYNYYGKVNKYYINGTYTGENFSICAGSYGITQNGIYIWVACGTNVRKYYLISSSSDPWLEVGTIDGTREWNWSGEFNTTDKTSDFSSAINTYLDTCTVDSDGYCLVPLYFYSDSGGIIEISNIEINYTYNFNPIIININLVQAYLNSSSNFTDVPIRIYNSRNGTIEISDIRFDYAGGNKTYEILAHDTSYSVNASRTVTFYYSDWDYSFPQYIDYLEFIPTTPTSKNVTPYGQTPSKPILNITTHNYGGKTMNFSIYLNETHSCVNLTTHTANNKSAGRVLNDTWFSLKSNQTYLSRFGIWMWADYTCDYSNWTLWYPEIFFRGCCIGCICDTEIS